MVHRKLQSELDQTLEMQLANCLDLELQSSPASVSYADVPEASKYDEVMRHLENVNGELAVAMRKIKKEKSITAKYVELCRMVNGLSRNYRELISESDAMKEELAELQEAIESSQAQLEEERSRSLALERELRANRETTEVENASPQFTKSQLMQMMQLMRITNASELPEIDYSSAQKRETVSDYEAEINAYDSVTKADQEFNTEEVREKRRYESHQRYSGKELLQRIDDALAQMPNLEPLKNGKLVA